MGFWGSEAGDGSFCLITAPVVHDNSFDDPIADPALGEDTIQSSINDVPTLKRWDDD